MDSTALLAREEEFRKLNKQLEKKTVTLMKEIENVMQKQDIFSEFSHNLSSTVHSSPKIKSKQHCCNITSTSTTITPELTPKKQTIVKSKPSNKEKSPKEDFKVQPDDESLLENNVVCVCCTSKSTYRNEDLEFLYAFVSVNVQDNVLPQSFVKDKVSVESVCKFLASKVKLMQEQINKLQSTLNRKGTQCESHLTQIAEFEGERLKLLNKTNNLRAEATETKARNMALQKRLDEKERLYKEQRSECDKLSSDTKRLRSLNATLEARCASQEQEVDRLKTQVDVMKTAEKDFRASTRNLSASHLNAISRLEAQLKLLKSSSLKQRELIDNLRRQNTMLSTQAAVKALEKDYLELLERD